MEQISFLVAGTRRPNYGTQTRAILFGRLGAPLYLQTRSRLCLARTALFLEAVMAPTSSRTTTRSRFGTARTEGSSELSMAIRAQYFRWQLHATVAGSFPAADPGALVRTLITL